MRKLGDNMAKIYYSTQPVWWNTGNDTATGDTTTTNKSINNKDKAKNFYDVADNYLFRQMMNNICETFTVDEEIRW